MSHTEVHAAFERLLPFLQDRVVMWFPNGRNGIRVRMSNDDEFVFTYISDSCWRFETRDCYVRSMKGGSPM